MSKRRIINIDNQNEEFIKLQVENQNLKGKVSKLCEQHGHLLNSNYKLKEILRIVQKHLPDHLYNKIEELLNEK